MSHTNSAHIRRGFARTQDFSHRALAGGPGAVLAALIVTVLIACTPKDRPDIAADAAPAAQRQATAETQPATVANDRYEAAAYTACIACHQASGAGVPGAFPPVRSRAAGIASLNGGRQYLMAVVSYGLVGKIMAGGDAYTGVMPGHAAAMSAAERADALNYLVFELNDRPESAAAVEPFTAAEIDSFNATLTSPDPSTAFELRGNLVERYGDDWPL